MVKSETQLRKHTRTVNFTQEEADAIHAYLDGREQTFSQLARQGIKIIINNNAGLLHPASSHKEREEKLVLA